MGKPTQLLGVSVSILPASCRIAPPCVIISVGLNCRFSLGLANRNSSESCLAHGRANAAWTSGGSLDVVSSLGKRAPGYICSMVCYQATVPWHRCHPRELASQALLGPQIPVLDPRVTGFPALFPDSPLQKSNSFRLAQPQGSAWSLLWGQ